VRRHALPVVALNESIIMACPEALLSCRGLDAGVGMRADASGNIAEAGFGKIVNLRSLS
jgi:hypothetical protein